MTYRQAVKDFIEQTFGIRASLVERIMIDGHEIVVETEDLDKSDHEHMIINASENYPSIMTAGVVESEMYVYKMDSRADDK